MRPSKKQIEEGIKSTGKYAYGNGYSLTVRQAYVDGWYDAIEMIFASQVEPPYVLNNGFTTTIYDVEQPKEVEPTVDVNFLLVNALRHLDNEQLKCLADAIYERIPKPKEVEGSKTAEEFLKWNCPRIENHPNYEFILKAMEEYANTKQVERREELIKFASYNFNEALGVNYDLIEIGKYIDEYLRHSEITK